MGNFFDGYTASAFRSIIVVIILLIIAIKLKGFEPLNLVKSWPWITGMLIASLFTWGPLYYATLHAGIGITWSISYSAIVIGMFFFGRLLSKEKLTKGKALSILFGLVGLALVFSSSTHHFGWLALLAAVLSGLSSAANNVFAKHIQYKTTQTTLVLWTCSIAANFIMAAIFTKSWPSFAWHIEWFYLVIFALVSVIASWSFVRGVKLVEAGAAGILGLLEIVFGVLFGVILFHERPGAIVLVGVLTIIIAAAIPYFKDFNAERGSLS